ncbi:MAG: hypothetical protein M3373_07905 [Gemmatimonadota bacterium]|nr:hypothetical protein [Gemmatimonadota bacterium]
MSEHDTTAAREAPLRVLGFVGSLRAASYNRALLRAAWSWRRMVFRSTFTTSATSRSTTATVEVGGDPA